MNGKSGRSVLLVGVFAAFAIGFGACGVEDPSVEGDEENVSQVQQAFGEGDLCGPSSPCSPVTLSCCDEGLVSVCRDLQGDEDNCGTCGNECPNFTFCQSGHCCLSGLQWIEGACRKPCSAGSPTCPAGQTCCTAHGHCANYQTDQHHCGNCTTDCGDDACVSGICQPSE